MIDQTAKPTITILRVLYPIWAIIGAYGILYVPSQIIVKGDALATAQNLLSSELLFRSGIASSILTQLMFIVIGWYLNKLFKSINQEAGLVMIVVVLVSVPIAIYNEMNSLASLQFMDQPDHMMKWLDMRQQGIGIASIFWGLWLFPLGYLVYHSVIFPKFLGIALYVGGLGYLTGAFLRILMPELETLNSITEMMTMGEIIWLLWLIIIGPRYSA